MMTSVQWILGVLHLLLLTCKDTLGAINVVLTIEPSVVELNQHSILRCLYDLGNAPLYSVKWYRGAHEFYRYTPRDHPDTKIFPFGGIHIDLHESNSTQVVLRKIDFRMSGNFTCEVTTDEAPVSTGYDSKAMLVVQLPEYPPTISVSRDPLDYGHVLKANCTSSPSKPPAFLKFSLNNITVAKTEISQNKNPDYAWSDLSLSLELERHHFLDGRLILRCTSQIATAYYEEAVLELESVRRPVPQRVSADSTANSTSTYSIVQFILLYYLLLFLNG